VITAGAALGHFRENQPDLPHPLPHLHLGAYPWPESLLRSFVGGLGRVLVLEEGHPYVERLLRGVLDTGPDVLGRLSGHLSADGELTPDVVRSALGLEPRPTLALPGPPLPERPPQLCQGCPHRDSFDAVRRAMDGFPDGSVMGDIGCYTLGALPPYRAIESCVCMGASIGMAKGAADAGVRPVLAVIGDSTFLHSGVTALMDAAAHDTPMTVLILDNETVGMTGQQPTVLPDSRLLPIVHGLGIDPEHVHHVEAHPRKVDELAELLRRELVHPGLSVVVGVRECIVAARHRKARERLAARPTALTGAGDVR
jgi:indolepyruvate ferredoxin oxidoreductase alpha subunit